MDHAAPSFPGVWPFLYGRTERIATSHIFNVSADVNFAAHDVHHFLVGWSTTSSGPPRYPSLSSPPDERGPILGPSRPSLPFGCGPTIRPWTLALAVRPATQRVTNERTNTATKPAGKP